MGYNEWYLHTVRWLVCAFGITIGIGFAIFAVIYLAYILAKVIAYGVQQGKHSFDRDRQLHKPGENQNGNQERPGTT